MHDVMLSSLWISFKAYIIFYLIFQSPLKSSFVLHFDFCTVSSGSHFIFFLYVADLCGPVSTITVQLFNLNMKYLRLCSSNLILIQDVVENKGYNVPSVKQIKKYEHWNNSS